MDKDDLYHFYLKTYLCVDDDKDRFISVIDVFTHFKEEHGDEITTLEMICLVMAYRDIKEKIPPRSDDDFLEVFEEKLNEHWEKLG